MRNPLLCPKTAVLNEPGYLESLYSLLSGDKRNDRAAYLEARQHLGSAINTVSAMIPPKSRLTRDIRFARWDMETANAFAKSGDWGAAADSQLHAVWKLQNVVAALQRSKKAYGYDTSGQIQGEIFSGSEAIANRENQKNIDDTAEPFEQHQNVKNPLNLTRDWEAENDYPSLAEKKSRRIHWPPRLR
jgi:hypothetical protein